MSDTCDSCGGTMAVLHPQVRDPQTGETFRIDRCTVCDLGETVPQPDDLGRYYGAYYHGGRHGITERLCMARRLGYLGAVATPGRLLDFGCGDGGFLAVAAGAGWQAVGVEMKPDDARAKGLTVVEDINETDGQFDVITLWHALEHMRSASQTIESLLPRLRPGGHILIAVPNRSSWQARLFGRHWFHGDVPRHLFHFTPLSLARLLTDRGLGIARRWNLEIEIDLFGWTQSALNLVLPHPNVLFDTLTRRGRPHGTGEIALSLVLASLVTPVCVPILPFAAWAGRGGIMVVAAQRPA